MDPLLVEMLLVEILIELMLLVGAGAIICIPLWLSARRAGPRHPRLLQNSRKPREYEARAQGSPKGRFENSAAGVRR